jgi:hypothetical protein
VVDGALIPSHFGVNRSFLVRNPGPGASDLITLTGRV